MGDLFSEKRFVIAGYQRPYDWGELQVKELAEDLLAHTERRIETESSGCPGYLLNSMLTVERDDGRLEIIDGQQRITTLLILFAVIETSHAGILKPAWKTNLRNWVGIPNGDIYDNKIEIEHCPEDTRKFLRALANQETIPEPDPLSSAHSLQRAYKILKKWVDGELTDSDLLRAFLETIEAHVYVAEVRVDSSAMAWLAFEKANDRGKPLSSADLIKSRLFSRANSERDRKQVADNWQRLTETLSQGQRTNRIEVETFLYHLALSDLASSKIGQSQIRNAYNLDEFKDKTQLPDASPVAEGADYAVEFSKYLLRSAEAYVNICSGKAPSGETCVPLQDLHDVPRFRKALKQYRQVLMAARHRDYDTFCSVTLQVERLVVTLTLIQEYGKSAQEIFALTKLIRDARDTSSADLMESLRKEVAVRFTEDRTKYLASILLEADLQVLGGEVTRYLLARLENYAEDRRSSRSRPRRSSSQIWSGPPKHIEHILPQSLPAQAIDEFGLSHDYEALDLVHMLGNLTIWERDPNSAAGNRPYSDKRRSYRESNVTITKLLPEGLQETKRSSKMSREIGIYSIWDQDSLRDRHHRMASVLYRLIVDKALPGEGQDLTTASKYLAKSVPRMPHGKNIFPAFESISSGACTIPEIADALGHSTATEAKAVIRLLKELDVVEMEDENLALTETGLLICSEPRENWESEIKRLIEAREDWQMALRRKVLIDHGSESQHKSLEGILKWSKGGRDGVLSGTQRASHKEYCLKPGTVLTLNPQNNVSKDGATKIGEWVSEDSRRGLATWNGRGGKNTLTWHFDNEDYSPSGLAKRIAKIVLGRDYSIQGTLWWLAEDGSTPLAPHR